MSDFDFQPYRDFILRHHEQQQILYTPTHVLLPLQVGTLEKREQRLAKDQGTPSEHQEERLPVLEGLRKYALGVEREHIILAGKPGSGKSTALQQLALAKEGLVTVLVKLKGNKPILEAIANELEKGDLELQSTNVKYLLRHQKIILLLDGVNEMSDELRIELATFRNEEQHLMVPMIFTTRDLAVGEDLGTNRRLEMKPLTERQMQDFIFQRLPVDGEKLLAKLGDRLREIAETPLLLRMLCDVFGQMGEIPKNKGELFRLFDREYEKFKISPTVSADFRRFRPEILQHLAFVMMTGDPSKPAELWLTIDRSLAEKEIEKFLGDRQVIDPAIRAKEWLENLLQHYLLQVAADDRQIEFHHQLFQEYYAAEKLLSMLQGRHPDITEDKRFQNLYLNYLKWTEPLKFLVGLLDDKAQVVRLVELSLEVDWMLGAKLSGEAKLEFRGETINCLEELNVAEWLLCKLLINYSSEESIPGLIKILYSSDLSVRDSAAKALVEMDLEKVITTLLQVSKNSDDAVKVLGTIDLEKTIAGLVQVSNNPDEGIRCSALEALDRLGYKGIFGYEKALNALDRIGSQKAIDELNKAKARDENLEVFWSFEAVSHRMLPIYGDDLKKSTPKLLEDLNNSDSLVRSNAAHILGSPQNNRAAILPDLLKLLPTESGKEALNAIQSIQANCKFYNYDIFCSPPERNQSSQQILTPQTINNFNNTEKVNIFENVENYHEHPPNNA